MTLPEDVRVLLADAFYGATYKSRKTPVDGDPRNQVIGPEHVYYGKIVGSSPAKDVYWAIGDTGYKNDPASRQDGPHIWKKIGPQPDEWQYLGDSGGEICPKVPQVVIDVWGVRCSMDNY
ncbi:hypothetical protein [Spirillospora sp. CA-128828]|uniref:hypothetical protein n=1 Tax=Spirillospora sp. CA-128828 TaxID=3240033 RepID=UPI003D8AEDA4